MKFLAALTVAATLCAQAPPPVAAQANSAVLAPADAERLATRMIQLIESTAVSVPGLVRASEPVKQNADMTLTALQRSAQSPALTYQFINHVKAYLALADSIPRPYPFPATADQQFGELRESLQRIQQHFEGILLVQNLGAQTRNADPNNRSRYAEANSKMLPAGNLPRVVFLGDSITDFWRLNEYFAPRDFVNRGISGQITSQMLGRFLPDVVALRPKAVVIHGGTNDISRGISLDAIQDNLAMMGSVAKAHGIKPIFASVLPVSDYHKTVDPRYEMTKTRPNAVIVKLNEWMKDYCRRENFVYVDYAASVVDGSGQLEAQFADDGLHPNARGYRLMSPVALEAIGRALSAQ